jgi:phage shock protein E
MDVIGNNKWNIVGIILGAILGYLNYYYLSCESGCMISSKPWNSTLYGSLMGFLAFNLLKK